MSCSQYTPCHETTCTTCNPVNPCYDNCGCLNPVDWACVNNPGTHNSIGVVNTDNGQTVLEKIDDQIEILLNKVGVVKADDVDGSPDSLFDKLVEGTGIDITVDTSSGTRKLIITATTGGTPPYTVKNTAGGTADFLYQKVIDGTYVKKSLVGDNMKLDVALSDFLSSDSGNQLTLGTDNKLKTLYTAPTGSETKITVVPNTGISVTGTGTLTDPYILSGNPSIMPARTRFNGVWKPLVFNGAFPSGISIVPGGTVQYRMLYNGSIEFRGNATFQVAFAGNGIMTGTDLSTTVNTAEVGSALDVTNGVKSYQLTELTSSAELKQVSYLDSANTIDAIPKLLGYSIRFASGKLSMVFNSTFTATRTITVSFDGAIYHPTLS